MAIAPRTIDVAALIDGRKLGPFNYKLIILSWLITVFDGLDMMMISFTAPYMKDELGLNKEMLGYVFSAGLFGMMLGGFVFSFLGDMIGRRRTIIIAAFSFGILTVATAFATNYYELMALRFVDGFAIGGLLPLAWALNIEFVPTRMRSTVVTIIMMGYSLGTAIAAPLTVWIAPHYGWEGVYFVGGLGTLVCAAALYVGLPESVRFLVSKGRRPDLVAATLRRVDPVSDVTASDRFILGDEAVLKQKFPIGELFKGDLMIITPLLWVGYIASSLAIYFAASWGPLLLEELHTSRTVSAYVSSAGGLLGAGAGLMLMRFTDRRGPISVAFYPALAVPILLFQGFALAPQIAFLPLVIVGGILISGGHFGILSIAGIFYPSAIRATGAGWATSVAKVGAVAGPIAGAAVLSSGIPIIRSYAILAICPAILCLCALGIAAVMHGRVRHEPVLDVVPAS